MFLRADIVRTNSPDDLNRCESHSKANQKDAADSCGGHAESRRTAMSVGQEITRCREQEEPACHSENERKVARRHGGDYHKRSAHNGRKCVCSQESEILLFR